MSAESLQERLAEICGRMESAAKRAGKRADEITLVAVSKTHAAEAIREAYALGVRHFGENRVQEWEGKRAALTDIAANLHLIGHLQSNKAARAARHFHTVDSADDVALARRLDRARAELIGDELLRVLIEVRVEREESKSGALPEQLPQLAEEIAGMQHLKLQGLMCIPPFLEDPEKVRPYFARLRGLRDHLETRLGRRLPVLSMGMSHDFEVAIEEGATEVRVGSALFGSRTAG
jgi:pyridoxal phosphate enzyme (YggS family)